MESASFWIEKLELRKHPEGGWFKEIYRSDEIIPKSALPERYGSGRNFSTSIYYLLEKMDKSNFHRIKSDELWHFYSGSSSIEILLIIEGEIQKLLLGPDFKTGESFQLVIPRNTWFAAHLSNKEGFALTGCTVAPGFDFEDFELADRDVLLNEFPHLKSTIEIFTLDN